MSREIAFVDPSIADLETFMSGLRPGIEAILLSPSAPAPEQMAAALRARSGLDAVHVVAHGAPGEVHFASGTLSLATLADHQTSLAAIGAALAAQGHLLLWSCEVGRGTRGAEFIAALEDATGAELLAATHLVGNAALGGTWQLAQGAGTFAAPPPLTPSAMQSYAGVLQIDLATPGIDHIVQPGTVDTLVVSDTSQIQFTDFFDGGADNDIIAIPLTVDLTGVSTTSSTGFHNYEVIAIINSSGMSQATFSASQFGVGLISSSPIVIGDDGGFQVLIVKNATTFSAATWTFATWQASDIFEIIGTTGNDTLTGSSQNDQLAGGQGNDILNGGASSSDAALFAGDKSTFSMQRLSATSWIITDNDPVTSGNEGSDTISDIEIIAFFPGGAPLQLTVASLIGALADVNAAGNIVAENAVAGTTVGVTALATDGDAEAVTYSLTNNAGGRFAVNASTGAVTVANGLLLNFEQATSHVITVRATSADHSFSELNFTINVSNVSPETITGTAAGETLSGGTDINRILGLGGNDIINGSAASETIIGGTGADKQSGNGGNDTFQITGSEGVGDTFNGGAGSDSLKVIGSASATLTGFNATTSSIEKWAGNSKGLLGTSAANKFDFTTLTAKSGLPFVDGKAGNDTLTGSKFTDDLRGGDGNDTIKGNAGSDELTGGKGRDTMTGGAGADDFNFSALNEMGKTTSTRDIIKDFTHLSDDIDLSAIDANGSAPGNAFKFLAAKGAAFTGVKGQLHWLQSGGNTFLEGDTTGDGKADFQIQLSGLKTISSADIIL